MKIWKYNNSDDLGEIKKCLIKFKAFYMLFVRKVTVIDLNDC